MVSPGLGTFGMCVCVCFLSVRVYVGLCVVVGVTWSNSCSILLLC